MEIFALNLKILYWTKMPGKGIQDFNSSNLKNMKNDKYWLIILHLNKDRKVSRLTVNIFRVKADRFPYNNQNFFTI